MKFQQPITAGVGDHPAFESYLAALKIGMNLEPTQQEEILRELRTHLRERLHAHRETGLSPDEAACRALAEFGDAVELGRRISRAERPRRWRRMLLPAVGLAASLAVMLGGWPAPRPESLVGTSVEHTMAYEAKENTMRAGGVVQGTLAWTIGGMAALAAGQAQAVPQMINHQGVVAVNGTRYTGTGEFRFAIVDPQDSDKNRWTNDGSQLGAAAMPDTAVSVTVTDGLYSVRLGETPAMTVVPASVFADGTLSLRIWFTHDANPPQQLLPDHALTAVPYALSAATVDDGAVTTAKLADGSVTGGKLASSVGVWSRTGSNLYHGSGNVGIGNSSPAVPLVIGSTSLPDANVPIQLSTGGNEGWIGVNKNGNYGLLMGYWFTSGGAAIRVVPANDTLDLVVNGSHVAMRIQPNGRIGVGTTSPSRLLSVGGSGAGSDGGVWYTSSSRTVKKDVVDLTAEEARETVDKLAPVRFRYTTTGDGKQHIGFIAEDVPELVATPDRKGLSSMDIVAVLTKVVQEQQRTIETLNQRVAVLEAGGVGSEK